MGWIRFGSGAAQAAANAFEALDTEPNPTSVADKLEAAGFGKRTRPTAASVLERLKQKTAAPAA